MTTDLPTLIPGRNGNSFDGLPGHEPLPPRPAAWAKDEPSTYGAVTTAPGDKPPTPRTPSPRR